MTKKIALEEHFLAPGCEEYWATTVGDLDPTIYDQVVGRLKDFGRQRLEAMDQAGVERAVLSLSGPGVQIERDRVMACRRAREANDFLSREIQERPDRYAGFAHLPMQDPIAAADELERCVRNLGFCGAMINGHQSGVSGDRVEGSSVIRLEQAPRGHRAPRDYCGAERMGLRWVVYL